MGLPDDLALRHRQTVLRRQPLDRLVLHWAWQHLTVQEACTLLGVNRRRYYHYVSKYRLGPKPLWSHASRDGNRRPDPTEEEIRAYTLSLQAKWSDEERERRAGKSKVGVALRSMGYDGRSVRFGEKLL